MILRLLLGDRLHLIVGKNAHGPNLIVKTSPYKPHGGATGGPLLEGAVSQLLLQYFQMLDYPPKR
jgi:hypothetical protein